MGQHFNFTFCHCCCKAQLMIRSIVQEQPVDVSGLVIGANGGILETNLRLIHERFAFTKDLVDFTGAGIVPFHSDMEFM